MMHHATLLIDMPEEVSTGLHVIVRRTEPGDYEALQRIFSGPRAVAGTMQMPLPSAEMWRRRLEEPLDGLFSLVACVDGEVVGSLSFETFTRWRMRHVATLGMVVRDDWQGKGVGTALMEAALDLADNWLGLTRVELQVFVDNAAAIAFRSAKASTLGSSRSPQNTPLTSSVPSSLKAIRSLSIL
jgi:putative acetyltransferase